MFAHFRFPANLTDSTVKRALVNDQDADSIPGQPKENIEVHHVITIRNPQITQGNITTMPLASETQLEFACNPCTEVVNSVVS